MRRSGTTETTCAMADLPEARWERTRKIRSVRGVCVFPFFITDTHHTSLSQRPVVPCHGKSSRCANHSRLSRRNSLTRLIERTFSGIVGIQHDSGNQNTTTRIPSMREFERWTAFRTKNPVEKNHDFVSVTGLGSTMRRDPVQTRPRIPFGYRGVSADPGWIPAIGPLVTPSPKVATKKSRLATTDQHRLQSDSFRCMTFPSAYMNKHDFRFPHCFRFSYGK